MNNKSLNRIFLSLLYVPVSCDKTTITKVTENWKNSNNIIYQYDYLSPSSQYQNLYYALKLVVWD